MFDGEKKTKTAQGKAKQGPLKRNREYREVSTTVQFSCYVASAAILAISVSEAVKRFGASDTRGGAFYVALGVLGVLFSVFITVLNNRNKKLLAQNKNAKIKKVR